MKHKLLILVLGLLILCAGFVTAQEPQACACCWLCIENGEWTCVEAWSEEDCNKASDGYDNTYYDDPCQSCLEIDCPLEAPEFTTVSVGIAVIGVVAITLGVFKRKK